jgi:hypothetical protein
MYVRYRGLRDAASAAGIAQQVGGIATPIAAPLIGSALSTTAATGAVSILGMSASVAVPVIGAALVGVTLLVTKLIANSGCGITCVETSSWANQAEQALKQNIDAYFSLLVPRPESARTVALANFDNIWAQLVASCSQPGTGNAGKRCVSDRQSGACVWKQTSGSPLLKYPGEPQPGQCWNWFSGYRDPIANDPNVVPDSAAAFVSSALTSASGQLGLSPALLLAGLAILIGAAVS